MELNRNVLLSIFIGVIVVIFLQILIPNITTPKDQVVENIEYTSDMPKEYYKINNLDDDTIIGKYRHSGDSYFVVYNKTKNKGESRLVKYDVWDKKEPGEKFEKGDLTK